MAIISCNIGILRIFTCLYALCNVPIYLISLRENSSSLIEFSWAREENNQGNMKNGKKRQVGLLSHIYKRRKEKLKLVLVVETDYLLDS